MNTQVSIPTASGSFIMKNPVMPAAATFGNIIEYMGSFDLSVLGALMPNSITIDTGEPTKFKKFFKAEYGYISSYARNCMSISEFNESIVPQLPFKTTPIVVNLKATDMDEMEALAATVADMDGIRGMEINLNCPYGVPGAEPYYQRKEKVTELVKRVKAVAKGKLVAVKTPSADVPLAQFALACQEGGADALTCFNGISGKAIDIRTRTFRCGGGGGGGYSGAGLKPIGIHLCTVARQLVDIPVIAAGGVRTAEDVLEYVMAGATVVQVGSANIS